MSILKGIRMGMIFALFMLGVSMFFINYIPMNENSSNYVSQDILTQADIDNSVSTQTITSSVINSQTQYIIKEINYNTGEETEIIGELPDKYIGMTREEFVASINTSNNLRSLNDVERGLLNMCVISFSPERVVVQASYKIDEYQEGYYLCVYDHKLIVYFSDMISVAMETDIYIDELPLHYRLSIIEGMYIESEAELYGLFENYTS